MDPVNISDIQRLVELFHIDVTICLSIGAFIGLIIAVLKQHAALTGKRIMIYAAVLSIILHIAVLIATKALLSDPIIWVGVLIGGFISWLIPVGGWDGLKQLAHHIGNNSK